MLESFRERLQTGHLVPTGSRVLVGYSGGADSTCLLHLLLECGIDLVAGHLHHGQREEAEKELRLCEAFCEEHGVPFLSGRANVPKMAQELGIGLEEAGRHARYAFFGQASKETGCSLIATAHTLSDQVETVLFNLARGTGLSGLAGIPERRDNIVRPLLPFTREQTVSYCRERGFWTHDDPANSDLHFSRARIRHRVLPELRLVNPAVEAAIARLSTVAREEDAFLNGMAAAALERSEVSLNGDLTFLSADAEVAFARDSLLGLPSVLFKRACRLAVEALGGVLDSNQTEALLEGVSSVDSGSVTCEGGQVRVAWTSERVHFQQALPTLPFRYGLTVPGETESLEFGWKFVAYAGSGDSQPQSRASLVAVFDREAVVGELYFRTYQPGDRIQPLGFDGTRKISDLLGEAGLTDTARKRLPVVCDMVGPIWLPGVCLGERAAAKPSSASALLVRFEPI